MALESESWWDLKRKNIWSAGLMKSPSTVDCAFYFMQQNVQFNQSYLEDAHQKVLVKERSKRNKIISKHRYGWWMFFHNYSIHTRTETKQGSKKCEIECANHALQMSRRMKAGQKGWPDQWVSCQNHHNTHKHIPSDYFDSL